MLDKFSEFLVKTIEKFLSYRKKKKYLHKQKLRKRNFMFNLIIDFLWAIFIVFLLNQYLVQAFKIPSGSMEDTLKIGDLLFVDKFSYGPELFPSILKMKGFKVPNAPDIVAFENPDYSSKGVFFDIMQRIIYMLTLTLIDIDKDEHGNPQVRFLVKRAVAGDGKFVKFYNGKMFIKNEGEDCFVEEIAYKKINNFVYNIVKSVKFENYHLYSDFSLLIALNQLRVDFDSKLDFSHLNSNTIDVFELQRLEYKYLYAFKPYIAYYKTNALIKNCGFYVPDGYILPIGDNRDNSHDGRFFGIIKKDKILGQPFFRYFPLYRVGIMY